ncbi:hypothetical protein J132_01447 [Termitomyces sp. J132]|nr:hypothetical protein J132_01447 [Termitomyces sp. J132]
MNLYVERPFPLTASQIKFTVLPPASLPPTAPGMEFGDYILHRNNPGNKSDGEPEVEPRRSQRCSGKKFLWPNGEPGRPNSGGFNLSSELVKTGWTIQTVECFLEDVYELAKKKLDLTKSYQKQDNNEIKKLCKEVHVDRFGHQTVLHSWFPTMKTSEASGKEYGRWSGNRKHTLSRQLAEITNTSSQTNS